MTTASAKYAVDLANDGVTLWHCDADQPWQLLGQVALSDQDFSKAIEQLKTEHGPNVNSKFIAQIRIPRSEIFVSDIDLGDSSEADITPKVRNFLAQNTPYSAQELVFDLGKKNGEDVSYVSAIARQTIEEAKEFIIGCGFEAEFYTTKLDSSDFPQNPCFYDADAPSPDISPPPPPVNSSIKAKPAIGGSDASFDNSQTGNANTNSASLPDDGNGKDVNTFATKRSKILVADEKSNKTAVPPPPARISIDAPRVQTTASVKTPIETPQGGVAKTDASRFFKLRYIGFIAALGLIAILFWFYSALTEGKEEISLLQQIPSTEPFIIAEPQLLKHLVSSDRAPIFQQNTGGADFQDPVLKIPKSLAEPTLYTGIESIQKSALPTKETRTPVASLGAIIAEPEKVPETQNTNNQDNALTSVETNALTDAKPETPVEEEPDLLAMADPELKSTLPKSRPPSISEKAKAAASSLLALADSALANIKPKRRPANLSVPKNVAAQEKIDPLEIDVAVQQAVSETLRPRLRPKSLGRIVAKANANSETTQTTALISPVTSDVARGTSKTSSPSPANIQQEATERAKVSKSHMSLIGVFGKPSARQALLRMPSGRFVKVKPGQRVSGWKVAAIGESSVRITKGSRNQVLRMPK